MLARAGDAATPASRDGAPRGLCSRFRPPAPLRCTLAACWWWKQCGGARDSMSKGCCGGRPAGGGGGVLHSHQTFRAGTSSWPGTVATESSMCALCLMHGASCCLPRRRPTCLLSLAACAAQLASWPSMDGMGLTLCIASLNRCPAMQHRGLGRAWHGYGGADGASGARMLHSTKSDDPGWMGRGGEGVGWTETEGLMARLTVFSD